MDHINNLKGKIHPAFLPYVELVMLCAISFYYNCAASVRSIYNFASSYQTISLNASTFNEFINKEVTKSSNKNVFSIGVWLSTVYIVYCGYLIIWYIMFGLIFVLLFPTICWVVMWGVVIFVKEKFLKDKFPVQVLKNTDKVSNLLSNNENENRDNKKMD